MKNICICLGFLGLTNCSGKFDNHEELQQHETRSIVLVIDSVHFENLVIDYLDSISFDNSEKRSGLFHFNGFPFVFHYRQFMLLRSIDNGSIDTLDKIVYPTANLHFFKETYSEHDSIEERREIALIDTMTIPFDSGHAYIFWFSTNFKRDNTRDQKVKWDLATHKLFNNVRKGLLIRGN